MIFKLQPFITASIFAGLLILAIFHFSQSYIWWVIGIGFITLFILIKLQSGKFRNTIAPLLLIFGSLPTLALVDSVPLRYSSIAALSIALYIQLVVREKLRKNSNDKIALIFIQLVSFLIFFLWANLVFASFTNFSESVFPLWLMLLITMLSAFLISRDIIWAVMRFEKPGLLKRSDTYIAGFLAALLTAEANWVIAFFPFSYRSSATILLAAYYISITSILFFLAKEEKKRILAKDIVVALIAIAIILVTARWRYF